jgi:hypothetical protein
VVSFSAVQPDTAITQPEFQSNGCGEVHPEKEITGHAASRVHARGAGEGEGRGGGSAACVIGHERGTGILTDARAGPRAGPIVLCRLGRQPVGGYHPSQVIVRARTGLGSRRWQA